MPSRSTTGLLALALMTGFGTAAWSQATSAPPTGATPREPSAAQAAQQERMRSCNAEAGTRTLAGEARRAFMSECLAGRMPAAAPASPARTAQQDRMGNCNAEAGTRALAGDARRDFMSECLAGRQPAPGVPAATPAVPPAAPTAPAASRPTPPSAAAPPRP